MMTMAALKSHPKVYWIWNHRRWCLENIPSGPGEEGEETADGWKKSAWDHELFVVEKLLDADARNCMSHSQQLSSTLLIQITIQSMLGVIEDTFLPVCQFLDQSYPN